MSGIEDNISSCFWGGTSTGDDESGSAAAKQNRVTQLMSFLDRAKQVSKMPQAADVRKIEKAEAERILPASTVCCVIQFLRSTFCLRPLCAA